MSILPGIYRHYKGGIYYVLGTAIHTETLQSMVIYKPLNYLRINNQTYTKLDKTIWTRPEYMFNGFIVTKSGEVIKRFTYQTKK